jgi:hypothetical protein
MAVFVYVPIAFITYLNSFLCIDLQMYQAFGVLPAKLAFHFFSFPLSRQKKRGIRSHTWVRIPLKKAKKDGYTVLQCVVVVWFKRSFP